MLAVYANLLLAQYCRWLPKGWPVLLALGSVGLALLALAIRFVLAIIFHWRFQFRIRFLLTLVLVFAVPFIWLAIERSKAKRQEEIVRQICRMEGYVGCRQEVGSVRPRCLEGLLGEDFFLDITSAFIGGEAITDAWLSCLASLPELEILDVRCTRITDAGMRWLAECSNLDTLYLSRTRITDHGLEQFTHLKKLRMLYLENTEVTDAGVAGLKRALPKCDIVR